MINEDTLIEGLIKILQKKKTYNRYEKLPLSIYQNQKFKFGDLSNLNRARKAAFNLVDKDPRIKLADNQIIRDTLKTQYRDSLKLLRVG